MTNLADWIEFNPKVKLEKEKVYPFVGMDVLTPGCRYVRANEDRKFTGGGSKFQSGDTLFARITPCLENGKISQFIDERAEHGLRAVAARAGYRAKVARLSDTHVQMVVDVEPLNGNPGSRHTFNLTMLPGQDMAELCRTAYPIAFEGGEL